MAADLISSDEVLLENPDKGLNSISSSANCKNPSSVHGIKLSDQSFTSPQKFSRDNGIFFERNFNSGSFLSSPAASASSKSGYYAQTWTISSAYNSGVIQFSGPASVTGTNVNGNQNDSEVLRKTPKTKAGCKRKASEPLSLISPVPTKIFINEKRISECLGRLTLNNNNSDGQPDFEEDPWFSVKLLPRRSQSELSFADLLDKVNSSENSKLVLCHGLQLDLAKRCALPCIMHDEIEKPLMQVMLWKPGGNIIGQIVENFVGNSRRAVLEADRDSDAAAQSLLLVDSDPQANSPAHDAVPSVSVELWTSPTDATKTTGLDDQDLDMDTIMIQSG